MIYGRSGTGKTTLAGTFPKRLLLLDVKDVGTDSISDMEDIDVRDITTFEEFEETYWWLIANPDVYSTVVIDTVSQLQQLVITEVLQKKNKDVERAGDWGTMTRREWGDVAAIMKQWIIDYRDLPMDVVFIAQDRVFNVDEEGDPEKMLDPEVGPRLSPSVAAHLNAAVSVIGNTFIREKTIKKTVKRKGVKKPTQKIVRKAEYCLRIGPDSVYITKFRKPRSILLPDVITDPNYEELIEIIKGE